jgi:hypothetical protein
MAQVKVPKSVKKVLTPDEEVTDKLSIGSQDFYATTQRLIVFRKSDMWVLLGWLWYLMAQKKYWGSMEYSKISAISFISFRSKAVFAMALFLFAVCLGFGILFFTMEGAAGFGAAFIAFGIIMGGILCLRKLKYHQIESAELSQKEQEKWRIPAVKTADKFVRTLKELSGNQ